MTDVMVINNFLGATMTNTPNINSYSENEILFAVENFINNVFMTGLKQSHKQELKTLLEQFDTIYDIDHYYSDYIAAFNKLKFFIQQNHFDWSITQVNNYDFVMDFKDEQLEFYEQMLKMLKGEIEQDLHQFRVQERNNKASLLEYVEELFNHYSKLLIVRVDLGYLNDSKQQVNIDQFYRHLEIMRNRLSNQDTFFRNLHGYSWAIEQGKERGYHVHLLLIYDGTKVQNGSYYAQRVGEKWQEITQGMGSYFNLHNREYIHELRMAGCDIGIGMVSRNNEGDWERLLTVIEYLVDPAKDVQRLRVKCLKNMQTFGHGQFEKTKRRGIRNSLS